MAAGTARRRRPTGEPGGSSATASGVNAWQDDPGDSLPPAVPPELRAVPDLSIAPLRMRIDVTRPPAAGAYQPGTPEFRYWSASEALARGAAFWRQFLPQGMTWQPGDELPVLLDEGVDFNAFYDRRALNFFHGTAGGRTVFSGESPDIACHEQGHAVLDALRPELFDAGSIEAAAFHEAFADICAILAGLQLQSFRVAILSETEGDLSRCGRPGLSAQRGKLVLLSYSRRAADARTGCGAIVRAALVLARLHRRFLRGARRRLPAGGSSSARGGSANGERRFGEIVVDRGAGGPRGSRILLASRYRVDRRRCKQWRQIPRRAGQRFCAAWHPRYSCCGGNDSRTGGNGSPRGTCNCRRGGDPIARATAPRLSRRGIWVGRCASAGPGGIGTTAAGHRGRRRRGGCGFGPQQRARCPRSRRRFDPARSYRCGRSRRNPGLDRPPAHLQNPSPRQV